MLTATYGKICVELNCTAIGVREAFGIERGDDDFDDPKLNTQG